MPATSCKPALLIVLVAAVALSLQLPAQASRVTTRVSNFPNRQQWRKANGYCGEMSIQSTALTRGVWVSQQKARDLGARLAPNDPDVSDVPGELLLPDNIPVVLNALGFSHVSWNNNVQISETNLQRYMVWVKEHLLAGYVVIFAARLPADEGNDDYYDHIMPMYGITYDTATAHTYDYDDVPLWRNLFMVKGERAMGSSGFYAARGRCAYRTGCIPTGIYNYATAIGGLYDAYRLFRPIRLVILGWSDGTPYYAEPSTASQASSRLWQSETASYQLDTSTSGIRNGQRFTIFRCDGEGSVPRNPGSIADLSAAPGCAAFVYTMGPGVAGRLNQGTLGALYSYSVVYFVAVLGTGS